MGCEIITYTISPKGDVEVTVEGVKGSGCLKLTEHVISAVGEAKELDKKPEFYDGGTGVFNDITSTSGTGDGTN